MNTKFFYKNVLPLIAAFIMAIIFFISYNQYLLDKSLTNLKVSLRQLDDIKDVKDARKVKDVLEAAFIFEITREDIEPAVLAKIEFVGNVVETASNREQLRDARFFLQDVVRKKESKNNWFSRVADNLFFTLFPQKHSENVNQLRKQIARLKREIAIDSGGVAQEKYLAIARLYMRGRLFSQAQEVLLKIVEIDPITPVALKAKLYLGFVYKFQGKLLDAKEIFAEAKKGLSQGLEELSVYQEGDCLYKMGRVEDAARTFEILFEKNPESSVAQFSQFRSGYINLYDLGDQQKAYESFLKLESAVVTTNQETIDGMSGGAVRKGMEPGNLFSYADLRTHIQSNVIPSIAKQFREAGFRLLAEGFRITQKGDQEKGVLKYKEALDKFALALKFYSADGFANSGRGLTYYFLGNKQEAIAQARRAHQLAPDSPEILANLAFIYYHLDMIDDSIQEYSKALMLAPQSAFLHYNLGTLYLFKGDLVKAIDHLKQAIQRNPRFPYSYNNLGYLLWLKEGYAEAKANLEKAISIKQNYVEAHYNLGILFFTLKDYEQAHAEFLIVEKLSPGYKETAFFLAETQKS